jgi:hypothetical protein
MTKANSSAKRERQSKNRISASTSRLALFGPPPHIEGEEAAVYMSFSDPFPER